MLWFARLLRGVMIAGLVGLAAVIPALIAGLGTWAWLFWLGLGLVAAGVGAFVVRVRRPVDLPPSRRQLATAQLLLAQVTMVTPMGRLFGRELVAADLRVQVPELGPRTNPTFLAVTPAEKDLPLGGSRRGTGKTAGVTMRCGSIGKAPRRSRASLRCSGRCPVAPSQRS